jgi:hypothetical protein
MTHHPNKIDHFNKTKETGKRLSKLPKIKVYM